MRRAIEPGERAPDFVLPLANGTMTRFYGVAGGALTVLVFGSGEIRVSTLQDEAVERVFIDQDGAVTAMYGSPVILFLDPSLRVLERVPDRAALAEAIARAQRPEVPAPVLMIPDALDLSTCAQLIAMFEKHGGVETGIESSQHGKRSDVLDPSFKRRRDLTITDQDLVTSLTSTVARRVIPEVNHAFAFKGRSLEGFKIARYDAANAGHFRPHRDNLSPSTAPRRFALTLNLNSDYDGGHLRFLEYGAQLYRPAAGDAILFSCSLLHEATEVTRGSRFVLLSFLLDAAVDRSLRRRG